ncbi:MAG: DUF305 domain-containing protein [Butyrivibrio sp.]|nr:DUF305 domain-containing protein [Butyrivibrio sp.]
MRKNRRLDGTAEEYLRCFDKIMDNMIKGMTKARLTDSLSHNFIVQMIPHHMAAIEMSRNILQYTDCAPLREIASGIIDEQTKSIENMREALCECSKLKNSQWDICMYGECFGQITRTMFAEMRNACAVNNVSADFMYEMIPHHEGAIRMSENLLRFRICGELVPILDAIIVSQKKGIAEMESLLKCV